MMLYYSRYESKSSWPVFVSMVDFGCYCLTTILSHVREYEAAVQELSICMAFAPEEEAEILEPFVEKLHLLRLESSWKSLGGIKVC